MQALVKGGVGFDEPDLVTNDLKVKFAPSEKNWHQHNDDDENMECLLRGTQTTRLAYSLESNEMGTLLCLNSRGLALLHSSEHHLIHGSEWVCAGTTGSSQADMTALRTLLARQRKYLSTALREVRELDEELDEEVLEEGGVSEHCGRFSGQQKEKKGEAVLELQRKFNSLTETSLHRKSFAAMKSSTHHLQHGETFGGGGKINAWWVWWMFPTEKSGFREPAPKTHVTAATASMLLKEAPHEWQLTLELLCDVADKRGANVLGKAEHGRIRFFIQFWTNYYKNSNKKNNNNNNNVPDRILPQWLVVVLGRLEPHYGSKKEEVMRSVTHDNHMSETFFTKRRDFLAYALACVILHFDFGFRAYTTRAVC